jgi:hypothetical protein
MVRFAVRSVWLCAVLVAAPVAASTAPASSAPENDFRSLWTGWSDANAASMTLERQAVERVRQDYVTANSERRGELQNQGRALGERVGEIVRLGDCQEGERVAREAGDFALVQAVRDYCATAAASAQ